MRNKFLKILLITIPLVFIALPIFAQEMPESVNLPFAGETEVKSFSLPLLTLVFGGLDGFNPCAMWVLLFLITLLINIKNKKRMCILGVIFIVTSAVVYFLFMAAWLNFFLFLGFVFWIRLAIALFAIGAGIYHLREFIRNKDGTCKAAESEKRQRIFGKIKKIVQKKNLGWAILGIIVLAGAVNLVELLCSTGLPAIYTSILTLTEIPTWQYYIYLLFYIFIFMLDDLIIFFIAMFALRTVGVSSKYTRWTSLIGGIIMIVIGLILILKPGWLMFG